MAYRQLCRVICNVVLFVMVPISAFCAETLGQFGEHFINSNEPSDRQRLHIETTAEIYEALATINSPTYLILAGGDYGNLRIRNFDATHAVLIRSDNPETPARFSAVVIQNSANLQFQSVLFASPPHLVGKPLHDRPFRVLDSRNIAFVDTEFRGTLATSGPPEDVGFPTGHGLFVDASAGVRLVRSHLHLWHRGAIFRRSSNVAVIGNDIHTIRSDGLNFSEIETAEIRGNWIHDFMRSPGSKDHADMIQFWTRGTRAATRDITIADNILDAGAGLFTQSIFMRNELADHGASLRYEDIRIQGNTIRNAQSHGITVGQANRLRLDTNALSLAQRATASSHPIPTIRVHPDTQEVIIRGHRPNDIRGWAGQRDWIFRHGETARDGQP